MESRSLIFRTFPQTLISGSRCWVPHCFQRVLLYQVSLTQLLPKPLRPYKGTPAGPPWLPAVEEWLKANPAQHSGHYDPFMHCRLREERPSTPNILESYQWSTRPVFSLYFIAHPHWHHHFQGRGRTALSLMPSDAHYHSVHPPLVYVPCSYFPLLFE